MHALKCVYDCWFITINNSKEPIEIQKMYEKIFIKIYYFCIEVRIIYTIAAFNEFHLLLLLRTVLPCAAKVHIQHNCRE